MAAARHLDMEFITLHQPWLDRAAVAFNPAFGLGPGRGFICRLLALKKHKYVRRGGKQISPGRPSLPSANLSLCMRSKDKQRLWFHSSSWCPDPKLSLRIHLANRMFAPLHSVPPLDTKPGYVFHSAPLSPVIDLLPTRLLHSIKGSYPSSKSDSVFAHD